MRENRTPGSARGLVGNGESYLNDEGTGSTVTNEGTQTGTSALTFANGAGFGAAGSGVSGTAGDFALDFTAAGGMGGAAATAAPRAWNTGAADSNQSNLSSFTLTGWFQTVGTTPIGNSARLADLGGGAFQLFGVGTEGNLNMGVANGTVSSTGNAYAATQEWVFFAVSFDGTQAASADRVRFYVGSIEDGVSLVGSTVVGAPGATAGRSRLSVGNLGSATNNPFHGLLDDFRLYGATTGGAGALSLAEIEDIRVAAIPEPSTYAALLGVLALGVGIWRRRRS